MTNDQLMAANRKLLKHINTLLRIIYDGGGFDGYSQELNKVFADQCPPEVYGTERERLLSKKITKLKGHLFKLFPDMRLKEFKQCLKENEL